MACILEKETELCSGSEEDELEAEGDVRSPTDGSEDSVDIKVEVITFKNKNKRKCSEPKKVNMDYTAKKRKSFEASTDSPFRPWSISPLYNSKEDSFPKFENRVDLSLKIDVGVRRKTEYFKTYITEAYLTSDDLLHFQNLNSFDKACNTTTFAQQKAPQAISTFYNHEPLALVSKGEGVSQCKSKASSIYCRNNSIYKDEIHEESSRLISTWNLPLQNLPKIVPSRIKFSEGMNETGSYLINKIKFSSISKTKVNKKIKSEVRAKADILSQMDNKCKVDKLISLGRCEKGSGTQSTKSSQGSQQKNYKNMTKERRIEANARERTRVHTISAAFDTLRRSIPAYSHNQKLSKLSVLRIACSYIITLSRLAGYDYSKDQNEPDLSNCVDKVSKTIQTEGKIKKKREY